MTTRIYDPGVFKGQGALINNSAMMGPHFQDAANSNGTGATVGNGPDFLQGYHAVFLRWQLHPEIGMPSEPFKVWRRAAVPFGELTKIASEKTNLPPLGRVVNFDRPHFSITAEVSNISSGPATVILLMLAGPPSFDSVVGVLDFNLPANGKRIFTYEAPFITGLLIMGLGDVHALHGLALEDAEKVTDWELVETVGLPVDRREWRDLAGQKHGAKQGMVGAETDPLTAATQRYARGVNPFGWHPRFPDNEKAPVWGFASAQDMIADAQDLLLPMLHQAMHRPPDDQAGFIRRFLVPPPQNPNGSQLNAENGKAEISPLSMLQLAVSTDPMQAVALGFGTGYPFEDVPTIHLGAISLFGDPDASDWDYRVTGRWARGLDGRSKEVEYAALIPRPKKVVPAPPPADFAVDFLAHLKPAASDQPWVASARMSWERFVLDNIVSVASFAAARKDLSDGDPAKALLEPRPSGKGHMPIGNTQNPKDPETVRQSATDSGFPIPNAPGSVSAKYAVATQNIFGIWSPWVADPFTSTQPSPDMVQIVDANLVPTDPGSGTICPAGLMVEFVLDWSVRRVRQVEFRGRLFTAATRKQDPPGGLPVNLQKSLTGAGGATVITFSGDTPSFPGGRIITLDAQGGNEVTPGENTQGQSRRYRMFIDDFSINFAATPHVGLALKAQATERLAPQRKSIWPLEPKTAYGSDPRARDTTIVEIVPLTSLPDASGNCHARLSWNTIPNAQGYILYESNETAILSRQNIAEAAPGTPLSTRLATLKAAFNADTNRDAFTRVNDRLLTVNNLDTTIPRGSQVIHVWALLPMSHGGIEGPWPSGANAADKLIVYAAPKIAEPAPPTLELRQIAQGSGFATNIIVGTRGQSGARPKRIDIYRTRVADAAREIDSMGLPIAKITNSDADFTVDMTGEPGDDWIDRVQGLDAPQGSWKHVWYRAIVWSMDDPLRGVRMGRSRPSPAQSVVIPPDTPPPLSNLVPSWPGGDLGDVLLDFNSAAPVPATPLGPHIFEIDITENGAVAPLLRTRMDLANLPDAPPVTGSGLWRAPDGFDRNYRILVRRSSENVAAAVTLRLRDPIGRVTERIHNIEIGTILPPVVIGDIIATGSPNSGKSYRFNIENTLDTAIAGQFYRIEITLTPASGGPSLTLGQPVFPNVQPNFPRPNFPQPNFPRPNLPGRNFGIGRRPPIIPIPGPVLDLGINRPRSQFREINGRLVYARAVKDISTTPSNSVFSVRRTDISGELAVTVRARDKIRRIEITIIAPDGKRVTKRARG